MMLMTAGTTAAYGYTLGPTGSRTGATELTGRSVTWSFDGIYRLTGETVTNDTQYNGSVSYGLDPVGNRLSASSSLHGVSPASFSYNVNDQILGETYDANANTTQSGGKTFAYDSENHLVSMNGAAVTMVYDGDGNRVAKTVSGSTTRYLVDDLNPTGYSQVVEETVNGAANREYTYGLQRIDEDQIINNAWTPSFYGYDGFGTVRQLTSLTGAVTDTYEYDAFGNVITQTGTTPNNYLYRGEQFDPDLGLYYLRARYYNPATGRFMSRDPQNGHVQLPVTLHKYLYAGANPTIWSDPSGRDIIEDTLVLERRSLTAVQYLNTIGCFANIGITGITTILGTLDPGTAVGVATTVYGCFTISWEPGTNIAQWAKTGLDVGTCALGLAATINDENEYFKDPTAINETKFTLDAVGGFLGCGLTGLGFAHDLGGS